ncbi:hypothetical protein FHR81_001776 [Actinoalloteichus hoggarensis]|uniref:hypothetical protein n=1 Tax=Actinoalloteichus hoggarensis TaxID=1470176 RepID=UPI000B8AD0BF|nr:hypothetical protein [Actinoalloteichus hoggarensis]MBB5920738.1 hypothetical protein [Actinoalloteichus hoggarensis]
MASTIEFPTRGTPMIDRRLRDATRPAVALSDTTILDDLAPRPRREADGEAAPGRRRRNDDRRITAADAPGEAGR